MILYILDTNFYKKQAIVYIIISIITMIFGLIYEKYSHNVISYFMLCAFWIPLILGAIVSIILYIVQTKEIAKLQIQLYNAGIATLTIGSIIKGVLDIYGTTNWKVYIYLIVGIFFILSSFIKHKERN